MSYFPRYELMEYISHQPIIGSFAESELRKYNPHGTPSSPQTIKDRRVDSENQLEVKLAKNNKWVKYEDLLG